MARHHLPLALIFSARHHLSLALIFTALATLAGGLSAQDAPPLSDYRTELMNGLQSHQRALRALVAGDVAEPGHIVLHARAVSDAAEMLQGVWAEGSGGEGTRALPAVWDDRDDFQSKLEELRALSARLRAEAESGDVDGVEAALEEVGQTCRGCHTTYRARAN